MDVDQTPGETTPPTDPGEPDTPAPAPRPSRPPLDPTSSLIAGAGAGVLVIGALGTFFSAWSFTWTGIILILVGLVGLAAGWMNGGRAVNRLPLSSRDMALGAGSIAAVLGVLFTVELIFDTDDLDRYGGIIGSLLTVLLAAAGVALYLGASRLWTGDPTGPWRSALGAGLLPTRLVVLGTGVLVLSWLIDVITGYWYLEAGSEVITLAILAAVLMRAEVDPENPLKLGIPAAYVALGLSLICLIIAGQHSLRMVGDGDADLLDWIAELLEIVGVVMVLGGAGLGSAVAARPDAVREALAYGNEPSPSASQTAESAPAPAEPPAPAPVEAWPPPPAATAVEPPAAPPASDRPDEPPA